MPDASEITPLPDPESQHKLGRRSFLKGLFRGALLGLGMGVTTGIAAAHELKFEAELATHDFFETSLARWYPNYERHDRHEEDLSPRTIDPSLQALSLEGKFESNPLSPDVGIQRIMIESPQDLLAVRADGHDTTPPSNSLVLSQETLDFLSENHILVALGDLVVPETYFKQVPLSRIRLVAGAMLTSFGMMTITDSDDDQGAEELPPKIERRSFMLKLGIISTLLGVGSLLPIFARPFVHDRVMKSADKSIIERRALMRIYTVLADLRPDRLNDLFRELIQANKLQSMAQNLKGESTPVPKVGYNWHYGHRGIEDWLRLGPDITRKAILAFPDDILREVIAANSGDPGCLYAIRVLEVPKSLKIVDPNSDFPSSTIDPFEQFFDQVFEDEVLKAELVKRGLA